RTDDEPAVWTESFGKLGSDRVGDAELLNQIAQAVGRRREISRSHPVYSTEQLSILSFQIRSGVEGRFHDAKGNRQGGWGLKASPIQACQFCQSSCSRCLAACILRNNLFE